ncbi:MAG TPA: hypothetical protein GXZ21_02980 [Clostridiales bacterium]|nr:hypothetical protein [Clostridiales bacterium]
MDINLEPLEIVLIVLGIIIIIVSFFLVGSKQEINESTLGKNISLDQVFAKEEIQDFNDSIINKLNEVREETLNATEDELSRLSNEKIMAVSEFSDQILEKIDRNHEEVVFLYKMLNDKEKEIKETVKEANIVQRLSKEQESDTVEAKAVEADNPSFTSKEKDMSDSEVFNNNEEILSLYSEGKSIIEISRLLSLGQGEVKLVIDLFHNKK